MRHTLVALVVVVAFGCSQRREHATPAEHQAARAAARLEQRAWSDKQRADEAVDVARQKQALAGDQLAAARDLAEKAADPIGLDWVGPPERWSRDFAAFAAGRERAGEAAGYSLEREKDGSISAWRRVQQVSGDAFDELEDAALATQVKAKLAADEDTRELGIAVDAKDHDVTLRGKVEDARAAGEAVRLALATPGVERVVSRLSF